MSQPQLAQPELTKLQRQVLQVFKKLDSKENVTGVARHLKIEPVLAKSLLDQLTELHLLRLKYEGTTQYYAMQQAGVYYLRNIANGTTTASPAHIGKQYGDAYTLVSEAGSYGISSKTVASKLHIDRLDALEILTRLQNDGFIRRWGQGRFHIPAAVRSSEKAAKPAEAKAEPAQSSTCSLHKYPASGQLQDERLKELKKALGELEQKIKYPPQILISEYELKQQVLQRLSQFFEESISSVLTDISSDLQHIHTFNSGVPQ